MSRVISLPSPKTYVNLYAATNAKPMATYARPVLAKKPVLTVLANHTLQTNPPPTNLQAACLADPPSTTAAITVNAPYSSPNVKP